MGPALETFLQALFLIALIAVPVILVLRKPLLRLWCNLRAADQKQLALIEEQERERKCEEEARRLALNELRRDCHIDEPTTEVQAEQPVQKRE
ncbi:MAG TPA: hypothetical protein VKU00_14800 [Chthonomonadaceae bacterium]|nr:hypothetical protein [Chthonomonadaceae bacterium]